MTDFTPTEDQARGLNLIRDWIEDPNGDDPFFVLGGYAGTGKSFSASQLIKRGYVAPSRTAFTAPTNKAVKVLRGYLSEQGISSPSKTIYSLLGLSLQANGEVKELTAPDPDAIDLSALDLVVVDEASMVNENLMTHIESAAARFGLLFLFMGDPAQLPPVGEMTSPIWTLPNTFTLTKVMRYGNAILDLATRLRNVVDHPAPAVKIETAEPVFVLSPDGFKENILADLDRIKAGDSKIIAWRNVKVGEYNTFIRAAIFGAEAATSPFLVGDQVVALEPAKGLEDEILLSTDEGGVIEALYTGQHPKHREIEVYNILLKRENDSKVTLRVPTSSGQFRLNNELESIRKDALSGKRYRWRDFWRLKESFHSIRPAYSITAHRAQGSSYDTTFVDRMDILLNRNRQEAFRCLYVACTRSRERLFIL